MPKLKTAPCVCMPSLGFVCKQCEKEQKKEDEPAQKEMEPQEPEHLKGLGYARSDTDGFNGNEPEYCSPSEHNGELIVEAAKEILEAKEI